VEKAARSVLVIACAVLTIVTMAARDLGTSALVATSSSGSVAAVDRDVTDLVRGGRLELRERERDPLLPTVIHERYQQLHQGLPVWGSNLVRQIADSGAAVSVLGVIHRDIRVPVAPTFSAERATRVVERHARVRIGEDRLAQLVVLPLDTGEYRLCFTTTAFTNEARMMRYFVDADSGEIISRIDDTRRQAAVGTGVADERTNPRASGTARAFRAADVLRPPVLRTFDMRGNLAPVLEFLNGLRPQFPSDLAVDSDQARTDGAVVDAHAYAGHTYDYFYRRHNRRGLNDADSRIINIVHPVRREDLLRYPNAIVSAFFLNAAYVGDGVMVYGVGLPDPYVLASSGQRVSQYSAALDVVAHELAHGVTDFSSGLVYENESGALNESFSDMMAVSTEFFFQPPGSGLRQADYLIGEDVYTPGGVRSLSNPMSFNHPDHYSRRFRGTADNGGVHLNSGIPNHAFYLAIEGGRNRVSGVAVTGVGPENREQIEKIFYRAFVFMLPASATFSMARAATIQSAQDLYGAGSAAERAVSQAWTAVGVS
jgi:thermolysin